MRPRPQKRRFQFGLATLLLLVALCGIAASRYRVWRPQHDWKRVQEGMSPAEVRRLLGEPTSVQRGELYIDSIEGPQLSRGEDWYYQQGVVRMANGRVFRKQPPDRD